MMSPISTERCLLRYPESSDVNQLVGLVDAEIARTFPLPWPYLPRHAKRFVKKSQQAIKMGNAAYYMIIRRDGLIMGAAMLHQGDYGLELGFWIAKAYQRQGYATEAAAALLRYGLKSMAPEIYAKVMLDNSVSQHILGKIGMQRVGVLLNQPISYQQQTQHLYLYQSVV